MTSCAKEEIVCASFSTRHSYTPISLSCTRASHSVCPPTLIVILSLLGSTSSPRNHVTVGVGLPLASQVKKVDCPSTTVVSSGSSINVGDTESQDDVIGKKLNNIALPSNFS